MKGIKKIIESSHAISLSGDYSNLTEEGANIHFDEIEEVCSYGFFGFGNSIWNKVNIYFDNLRIIENAGFNASFAGADGIASFWFPKLEAPTDCYAFSLPSWGSDWPCFDGLNETSKLSCVFHFPKSLESALKSDNHAYDNGKWNCGYGSTLFDL